MFENREECQFDKAWVGYCKEPTLPDQKFCAKHIKEKCASCGEQATKECPEAGSLVCGAPLCDNCEGYQDTSQNYHGFIGTGVHRHRKKG